MTRLKQTGRNRSISQKWYFLAAIFKYESRFIAITSTYVMNVF